jgi:ribose/xylose/arabinose/galactoside ABC-type transport system permease subunit
MTQRTANDASPAAKVFAAAGRALRGALGPLAGLIVVTLFFAAADKAWGDGAFFTVRNFTTLSVQIGVVTVAALGMTLIIIAGGIDLSAGTSLALSATVLALAVKADLATLIVHRANFESLSRQVTEEAARGDESSVARERLKRLLVDKRKIAERILAGARAREASANAAFETSPDDASASRRLQRRLAERRRWERYVKRLEERIQSLASSTFTPASDPEWKVGVPNSPFTAPLAVMLGVLVGVAAGLFNGLLISGLRVVPFIVTLGTMTMILGLGNLISENSPVRPGEEDQIPRWLAAVSSNSQDHLWGEFFSPGLAVLLALAALLALVLRYTVFGRFVFAIGSNEATARLCGVNTTLVKIGVYSLAGAFFGIAGVYQFSRTSVGDPTSGVGQELAVIAAVVIGGGSLSGGRGSVLGTLAGAAIMAVITSGCRQLGLAQPLQLIILGAIIILAVTIDQLRQRRSGAT